MTLDQFHNALRIMTSIDMSELVEAGVIGPDDTRSWLIFSTDPFRWFVRANDRQAMAVFGIIEARQPASLKHGVE